MTGPFAGAPPRQVGPLTLRTRVLAAPMCGATKPPYRRMARRFGADVVFTEMVKAHLVVERHPKTLDLLARVPGEEPVGAQVCGADPDVLARAATILEELGFALVDINMGCPVRKVVQRGAGAALLRDPARVEAIVAACRRAVAIPVTAKIRSGWDDAGFADPATLARAVEAGGGAWVTIHGRTRTQRHDGAVDTDGLAAAKAAVAIPVIANGGIRTGADAALLAARTGCDAVMIGRGAYGRPWLFRDAARALRGAAPLPEPTVAEVADLAREHLDGMVDLLGDHGVRVFRKAAGWYLVGPELADLRDRAHRTRDPATMRAILAEWRRSARPAAAQGA